MNNAIKSALLITILICFAVQAQAAAFVSLTGNCNGNSPCYPSINNALNEVDSGTEIRIKEGTYIEDVILTTNKNVELTGGWNSAFNQQTGASTIRTLTIEKGDVEIDKIIIKVMPYENCCLFGVCSPLSSSVCQQSGGIPINAPCDPNPCNF